MRGNAGRADRPGEADALGNDANSDQASPSPISNRPASRIENATVGAEKSSPASNVVSVPATYKTSPRASEILVRYGVSSSRDADATLVDEIANLVQPLWLRVSKRKRSPVRAAFVRCAI